MQMWIRASEEGVMIKRYDYDDRFENGMMIRADGKYVLHANYEKLQAELEAALKRCAELDKFCREKHSKLLEFQAKYREAEQKRQINSDSCYAFEEQITRLGRNKTE